MAKINKIYQEVKIISNYNTLILSCIQRHLTAFCNSFVAAFLGNNAGGICVSKLKILYTAS
jgi:hypothetical protein